MTKPRIYEREIEGILNDLIPNAPDLIPFLRMRKARALEELCQLVQKAYYLGRGSAKPEA